MEPACAGDAAGRAIVASFTGAWIETDASKPSARRECVASFTGAWIETLQRTMGSRGSSSRLLHGGVDRNDDPALTFGATEVPSFTGAWIETAQTSPHRRHPCSPP